MPLRFKDIPSTWWQISTVLIAAASVLSLLIAVTTLAACCITYVVHIGTAKTAGIIQLIAGESALTVPFTFWIVTVFSCTWQLRATLCSNRFEPPRVPRVYRRTNYYAVPMWDIYAFLDLNLKGGISNFSQRNLLVYLLSVNVHQLLSSMAQAMLGCTVWFIDTYKSFQNTLQLCVFNNQQPWNVNGSKMILKDLNGKIPLIL